MLPILAVVLAAALLNRVRGGGLWIGSRLPGRALWWSAVALAGVALLVAPWPVAVAWGLAFLVWGMPPWGHLIGLGRFAPDRNVTPSERWLLRVCEGSEHLAFFLRNLAILPGLLLVAILVDAVPLVAAGIIAAGLIVAVYEAAWRLNPRNPIWLAEIATGALWGALIVGVSLWSA
jgi:hypothetical protein